MSAHRAGHPACEARRWQANGEHPGSGQRPYVRIEQRLPVACDIEGLAAASAVNGYLVLWDYDGRLDCIHHALYVKCREQAEREASPTAAIIDSQSVKSAEKGACASIRMTSTRARKSKARSATSSSHPEWQVAFQNRSGLSEPPEQGRRMER